MELVVKLRPDVADAVRTGSSDVDARTAVESLGLSIRPMHATRPTGPLSRYFVVDAPAQMAEQARSQLSGVDGVESATVTPAAGLP